MTVAANVARVRARMAEACARAGRDPTSVKLVAVSKNRAPAAILEAAQAGVTDFGENRVEEAGAKLPALQEAGLTWHMVGHIQSRKARDVAALFDVVHSLDSVRLAQRLSRFWEREAPLPVLLEVNVSGEASKYGWDASHWRERREARRALWEDVATVIALPNLEVCGLMTMAPIVPDMEQARPVFASLRALRDALAADFPGAHWSALSMGMTDDYPVAVEEGATMVRIGRAIFETGGEGETPAQ
ncbi:MAG: YggS family pyridoxal phosphate-dependent enzyme [Anaerolineae bacterium]